MLDFATTGVRFGYGRSGLVWVYEEFFSRKNNGLIHNMYYLPIVSYLIIMKREGNLIRMTAKVVFFNFIFLPCMEFYTIIPGVIFF